MSKHFSSLLALTGSLMAAMVVQSQEPLVIQPAKVQVGWLYARSETESVLGNLDIVLTRDKMISRAWNGGSSGLGVSDLNTLEEELRFFSAVSPSV